MARCQNDPIVAKVWEGSSPVLMARVTNAAAVLITQASLSAIAWTSRDAADTDTEVDGDSLTIADVIFDSLQTDDRWTADATGYNFRFQLPATAIPNGNTQYLVQVELTSTDGTKSYFQYTLNTRDQYFN